MQTLDGSGADSDSNPVNPTHDARHASTPSTPLTDSQAEFWYLIECQDYKELAHSLKMVHDLGFIIRMFRLIRPRSRRFLM